MQELNQEEIEVVGGAISMKHFAMGAAMVGIGLAAGAAIPFLAVGAAASYGIGLSAGVLVTGGGWMIAI